MADDVFLFKWLTSKQKVNKWRQAILCISDLDISSELTRCVASETTCTCTSCILLSPVGRMPRTGDIGCASVPNRGGTLCVRLSPNRFTYLHILGANQLYNLVDVQHTFHFDLDFISDLGKCQKTFCILYIRRVFCILYIRRVVQYVCDSAQTASHVCTYLVPINCTIIVDVQHAFHFDFDFISDPG